MSRAFSIHTRVSAMIVRDASILLVGYDDLAMHSEEM